MSEWISVKNKLPEYDQRVLIYNETNEYNKKIGRDIICGHRVCTNKKGEIWISDVRGYNCMPVTHWMPLPDPPEGEK
ncbi:MAG: DUF551 domain-containing protein [Candidatus Thorarchaeota archaeon]|jgi:hypothetical protein